MQVRVLEKDEGALLKDLFIRMTRETPTAFAGTLEELEQRSDADWQGLAEHIASSPNMDGFVAENEDEAYGFVSGAILTNKRLAEFEGRQADSDGDALSDTAMLGRMWVAPDMRGQGLGQELIRAVLVWSEERDLRRVLLAVTEGNERARRSYLRAKFEPLTFSMPHPTYPELTIYFMEYVL